MSNRLYDALKFASLVVIPTAACVAAIITAVKSGGSAESVILAVGEAIATFLGTVLVVASKIYWKEKDAEKAPNSQE